MPRRSLRGALRVALQWLPPVILAAIAVAAAAIVVDLHGPPAPSPSVSGPRPSVPLLSLRRNLDPLQDAAADRSLRDALDSFVAAQPDDTCLQVRLGDVRYEHRTDDPQAPASLQKLLTAVAALTELGADATYRTDVRAAPVVDGTVPGNLYLQGSGDPVMATADYVARERNQPQIFSNVDALADAVVGAGVREVAGSVVGDEHRYDGVRYNPAWPSRFVSQGQIGPVSALSVNDGFAYFPDRAGVFGAAPDPAAYAATVLDGALRARGVVIAGEPASGSTPTAAQVVASHHSPPMSEIVVQMLRESDNNTAELLLKELGRQRTGEGSFGAGQAALASILDDAGIDIGGVNVADGSGLATENVVTCELIVEVLDHGPTSALVEVGLAVAGETGTLARRWLDSELVGRVRAKTGTLNQVTALAGYADSRGGAEATFALLVNVDPSERIGLGTIAAQERLVEALVAHPALPDVDALRPGAATGDG